MRNATFRTSGAVVILLVLVACGGGAATTQGPAGTTPTQPQATAAGAPTNAPTNAVVPTNAATNAPTAGSSSAEACSLLTVEEVAAAFGETLDTAEPSADDLYSNCKYSGDGGEVTTFVGKSPEASLSYFNTMKINDGEAVSGVGDEAYWSTDSFMPGLYFMKGGHLFYISGSVFGPEAPIVALGVLLASRI